MGSVPSRGTYKRQPINVSLPLISISVAGNKNVTHVSEALVVPYLEETVFPSGGKPSRSLEICGVGGAQRRQGSDQQEPALARPRESLD